MHVCGDPARSTVVRLAASTLCRLQGLLTLSQHRGHLVIFLTALHLHLLGVKSWGCTQSITHEKLRGKHDTQMSFETPTVIGGKYSAHGSRTVHACETLCAFDSKVLDTEAVVAAAARRLHHFAVAASPKAAAAE